MHAPTTSLWQILHVCHVRGTATASAIPEQDLANHCLTKLQNWHERIIVIYIEGPRHSCRSKPMLLLTACYLMECYISLSPGNMQLGNIHQSTMMEVHSIQHRPELAAVRIFRGPWPSHWTGLHGCTEPSRLHHARFTHHSTITSLMTINDPSVTLW